MNYQIIKDEKLLKEFIDWLPDLNPEEKYYLCLFARNKYCKELTHIKSDKAQLKRFVSDKERMFNKIQQLEIEVGRYKQKDVEVPETALALYITPNPRNMHKATINTMVKLAQGIRDSNICMNPHQEALSEVQKAKSRTVYVDFDFDFPEDKKYAESLTVGIKARIKDIVNPEAVHLLRTRGGIHALVKPELVALEKKNSFYRHMKDIGEADQTGDQLIPVPGVTQGGFVPHFINF